MNIPIPSDDTPEKQCAVCKQFFPPTRDFFYRNHKQPDRLRTRCKWCSDAIKQEHKGDRRDGEKRCSKCRKWFPATLDYFYKCSKVKDELESQCKNCRKDYQEQRKDITKEYKHSYYIAHPKKYTREQRDHRNRMAKERRKANPKKYRTIVNNRRQAQRIADPEKNRIYNHRVYENNRQLFLTNARNRKARKKAVPGTHTATQIAEQLKRQHYHCYYAACGHAKFKKERGKYIYEVEHTYPLSRVVGTGIPANDMGYIVLACPECNGKKRDKFPWEWPEGGRLL